MSVYMLSDNSFSERNLREGYIKRPGTDIRIKIPQQLNTVTFNTGCLRRKQNQVLYNQHCDKKMAALQSENAKSERIFRIPDK